MTQIKEIKTVTQLESSLEVIRTSFGTVAREMNLRQENAPSHPSFSTMERLRDFHKRASFYGLYDDKNQVGFVAVEKGEGGVYYMDRLAVLPEFRHRGYGRQLVEFALDAAKRDGGKKVALGMIDKQKILKDWYKSLGFRETGTRQFEHLPFVVCFMEIDLSA